MEDHAVLGIDTSNYTTSAALCGAVEFNGRKLLPVAEGQLGLRQSDAVFHHTRQLPELVEEACRKAGDRKISAIGVSERPREAADSYMPCFLVGAGMARGIAAALGVSCYAFSHQQGHVAAAAVSAGRGALLRERFLAFHLSGGTTEALLVTPGEEGVPSCRLIASSLDLKAGQAVDRVGVALGLPFPAGKYLDELARSSSKQYRIKPSLKGADMSLSGLQNQCESMIRRGESPEDVANFCISSLTAAVEGCLKELLREYGPLPVLFSGGVSSNSSMRQFFAERYEAVFAQPEFSSDNAFGTAVLAAIRSREVRLWF